MTDAPLEPIGSLPEPNDEDMGSAAPIPRRRNHRRMLLASAVVAAMAGVLVLAVRPVTAPAASPSPTPSVVPSGPVASAPAAVGYIAERSEIMQRVAWAKDGQEPFASGLRDLLEFADEARLDDPRPRQPLNISGTGGPFVDDTAAAYGLAMAYVATDDVSYAEASSRYLMAWATTTKTTRNTCTDGGDCQTSLIISRNAPGLAFAADLIAPSAAMSPAQTETFRAWLRDVILPTASERDNNWGDAGTFARIALTSYLGDVAGFDAAVARWRAMMDFVAADGHIPEEVRRGSKGIMYTQEALQYKVGSAVIAARRGIDLWDYQGSAGGTLKGSIDYLVSYLHEPDRWPWDDHAEFPTPSPMWELVYAHWPQEPYIDLLMEDRPFSEDAHSAIRWTTISNGIPLLDAAASRAP
jgi:Alginate lyase